MTAALSQAVRMMLCAAVLAAVLTPAAQAQTAPGSRLFSEETTSPFLRETALRLGRFEQRATADRWLAPDKAKHLSVSFLLTLSGQYALEEKFLLSERTALPLAMTGSALVGLAKELYDWRLGPTRYFSRRDLVADALGILLAAGFILL